MGTPPDFAPMLVRSLLDHSLGTTVMDDVAAYVGGSSAIFFVTGHGPVPSGFLNSDLAARAPMRVVHELIRRNPENILNEAAKKLSAAVVHTDELVSRETLEADDLFSKVMQPLMMWDGVGANFTHTTPSHVPGGPRVLTGAIAVFRAKEEPPLGQEAMSRIGGLITEWPKVLAGYIANALRYDELLREREPSIPAADRKLVLGGIFAGDRRRAAAVLKVKDNTYPKKFDVIRSQLGFSTQNEMRSYLALRVGLESVESGLALALQHLLERKFGPISVESKQRIEGASRETLLGWIASVLTASSIAEVLDR